MKVSQQVISSRVVAAYDGAHRINSRSLHKCSCPSVCQDERSISRWRYHKTPAAREYGHSPEITADNDAVYGVQSPGNTPAALVIRHPSVTESRR